MNNTTNYSIHLLWLAAGVALLSGCDKIQEETAPPPPPEVLIQAAGTKDVPVYREWIGTLDGSENAEIRARVSGYLTSRDYQEGALVKKGDLLFEIDERPFQAALDEAVSQLEQARAIQIASEADAERSKELFSKNATSEKEMTNKIQINQSNLAKIKALEAAVEQAKLNLEFCKITSPVEGIAAISQAQVGDLVGTASSAVLTTVSTLDPIKILFPISEIEYLEAMNRIQQNVARPLEQREEFIDLVLANGDIFPQKARLLSVDMQVKASTGTILATATLKNPGSALRPGQFARARVLAKTLKDAVIVPQRAIAEVQGLYQIAIVGADGKMEIRPVKVGPRVGTDWVITEGLKAGENVVVEGFQKAKSGEVVISKPWLPPAQRPTPAINPPATADAAKTSH